VLPWTYLAAFVASRDPSGLGRADWRANQLQTGSRNRSLTTMRQCVEGLEGVDKDGGLGAWTRVRMIIWQQEENHAHRSASKTPSRQPTSPRRGLRRVVRRGVRHSALSAAVASTPLLQAGYCKASAKFSTDRLCPPCKRREARRKSQYIVNRAGKHQSLRSCVLDHGSVEGHHRTRRDDFVSEI
jgi:hypothetical protein